MQWTSGGHSSIIDHQKVTAAEIIVIDKQVETTFKFGTEHVTQSRLGTHGQHVLLRFYEFEPILHRLR